MALKRNPVDAIAGAVAILSQLKDQGQPVAIELRECEAAIPVVTKMMSTLRDVRSALNGMLDGDATERALVARIDAVLPETHGGNHA